MNNLKRILSLTLALVMVLGMVPTAFAAEGDSSAEVEGADLPAICTVCNAEGHSAEECPDAASGDGNADGGETAGEDTPVPLTGSNGGSGDGNTTEGNTEGGNAGDGGIDGDNGTDNGKSASGNTTGGETPVGDGGTDVPPAGGNTTDGNPADGETEGGEETPAEGGVSDTPSGDGTPGVPPVDGNTDGGDTDGEAPVCPGTTACQIDGCTNEHAKVCTCDPAPAEGEPHQEGCDFWTAPAEENGEEPTVCETILEQENINALYSKILELLGSNYDGVMALTLDEITQIRTRIAELDPEQKYEYYVDLMDTLARLPANACPECGELDGHAEDCINYIQSLAGTGKASGTMNAEQFLAARDTANTIQLTGDTTITSRIMIQKNDSLILDLNGHVLISNVQDSHSLLHCLGTLTIKSSDSTREHKGTMLPVTRWIDKRTNYSTYGKDYNVDSSNHFYGRYIQVTTSEHELWKYDGTGSTVIKGGVITGAFKYGSGSAIYVDGGTLNIQSGTIAGNTGRRNVVYDADKENKLANNPNNPFGGAVYATGSNAVINMSGGTISYNWGDYYGGAVCIANGCTMNMTSGVITDNCAQGSGGGIGVRDNSVLNLGTDKSVNYNSVAAPVISYNRTFDVNYTGGGGGIEVTGATLNYEVGSITHNRSSGSGAGIYCYRGGSVNASTANSRITDNYAGGSGGAIFLQYGDVNLNGCILNNNESRGSAGAVGIRVGNFNMIGGEIKNNKAANHGGAVYVTSQNNITPHYDPGDLGCSASITGTVISGNTASQNGGAVYVSVMNSSSDDCKVDLTNCVITNNKSSTQGGAVFLCGGTLTIDGANTLVQNNTAPKGGAFYVEESDKTNPNLAKNSYIYKVIKSGWKDFETLSESDVQRITDPATAIKTAIVYIKAGKFENNSATNGNGGVFYVSGTKAEVYMSGGEITTNTATKNGGALYISGGNFELSGGILDSNIASGNGGAVYVNDGDFNMISGKLSNNKSAEYGGGAFVHGGNITIGVNGCNGSGDNHSVTHTSLAHPEVLNNEAPFGGGLAVDGGQVDIYCGQIINNESDNNGTGMNIFMYDSSGEDSGVLNHWGGTVGEDTNHGIVVIGGELNVPYKEGMMKIKINYHDNGKNLKFEVWVGEAPEEYYLNLPYCPQEWEDKQNNDGLTFVGWTYDRDGDKDVEEEVDLSYIRKKSDYRALGDPAPIKKVDWKKDDNGGFYIDFYAVWAPKTSNISYRYSLDGGSIESTALPPADGSPTTYTYSLTDYTLAVPNPSYAGYAFKGWKMYADKEVISNWDWDASVTGDPTQISQLKADTVTSPISVKQNFGDIVLVAVFERALADLTVVTSGDQSAVYTVKGTDTDADRNNSSIEFVIAMDGNNKVTVKDIPVGNYTVTEVSHWTWRYTGDKTQTVLVNAEKNDAETDVDEITFTFGTVDDSRWLNGYGYKKYLQN